MIGVGELAPATDERAIRAENLHDQIGETLKQAVGVLDWTTGKEEELEERSLGRPLTHELARHGGGLGAGLLHERTDAIDGGADNLGEEGTGAPQQRSDLLIGVQALNETVGHHGHAVSEPDAPLPREICSGYTYNERAIASAHG